VPRSIRRELRNGAMEKRCGGRCGD